MKKFQPHVNLAEMDAAQRISTIEAFIHNELTIAHITIDRRFIHFSPQLWYLSLGKHIIPRHIIAMRDDQNFTYQGS